MRLFALTAADLSEVTLSILFQRRCAYSSTLWMHKASVLTQLHERESIDIEGELTWLATLLYPRLSLSPFEFIHSFGEG